MLLFIINGVFFVVVILDCVVTGDSCLKSGNGDAWFGKEKNSFSEGVQNLSDREGDKCLQVAAIPTYRYTEFGKISLGKESQLK